MSPSRRLSSLLSGAALLAGLAAGGARAENAAPERFLAFPAVELAAGGDPVAITLANHLRDPDVPGTAVRVTVRLGATTRAMDLALFDAQAPATVANFVAYVEGGRYANNFIHRSVPGFIIQNGGFYFVNDTTFDVVATFDPVVNEPGISNTRGTIAMAKLGGDPNSATSQWFVNLADNSENLDAQNGGFTVFGRVLGEGMAVADDIAAVTRYNAGSIHPAWTDIPLTVGALARENFIETSAALVPALSHTVQTGDAGLVAAAIQGGVLTLTPADDRVGAATITVTTTDLEGAELVSSFTVSVMAGEQVQSITFGELPNRVFGDAPFVLAATADSGLPVGFTVVAGPATLGENGLLTLTGAGSVTVRAGQPGDVVFAPAVAVERTFQVEKAAATITLANLTQSYTGGALLPGATTGPAGLAVGFVFAGRETPPILPGSYGFVATIADDDYAGMQSGTLVIEPAGQAITPPSLEAVSFGAEAFVPPATASSGLAVGFEVVSGPAEIVGGQVRVTGVGEVVLRAIQPGNALYTAAESVTFAFAVAPAEATVALEAGSLAQVYDGMPQAVSVTTNPAGLNVVLAYDGAASPPRNAGTYAVVATINDERAANQATASGTLVVAKAPLTVRAPVVERAVTRPNPVLAASYEGLAAGDTAETALTKLPIVATRATAKSAPGVYPVTLTGAGASANYEIALVPGALTVRGYGGTHEALLTLTPDSGFPELLAADPAVAIGKVTVTVPAAALTFSGVLDLWAEPGALAFKGTLTPDAEDAAVARAAVDVFRRDSRRVLLSAYTVRLVLEGGALTVGVDYFTPPGNAPGLAVGAAEEARYATAARQNAPWTGAHTLLLTEPGAVGEVAQVAPPPHPNGPGHATASIAGPTGALTAKGRLGDGTTWTASVRPDAAGMYRVFTRPYGKRAQSFLSGGLAMSAHPDAGRFPGRFYVPAGEGVFYWIKAAGATGSRADALYPNGFGLLRVTAMLDPWLPPAAAKKATRTAAAQPAVTLAQRLGLADGPLAAGDLGVVYPEETLLGVHAATMPGAAALGINGKVVAAENPHGWSLAITPATGAFTGSFTLRDTVAAGTVMNPDATRIVTRKVAFSGVLRQRPELAGGDGEGGDALLGAARFTLPGLPGGEAVLTRASSLELVAP